MNRVPTRRRFLKVFGATCAAACLRTRPCSAAESPSLKDRYDLVVVGIGSAGFGAALAGARMGLDVLLLEEADRIGGNAVSSGVSMWEPGVGGTGFPFEIYQRLKPIPNAVAVYSFGRHIAWDGPKAWPGGESVPDPACTYLDTLQRHRPAPKVVDDDFRKAHWHGVIFEPGPYERVLRTLLEETGRCTLLTGTTFTGVDFNDGRIACMTLSNGATVSARAFVDGTGGGALCKACGCETMLGQDAKSRFDEPSAPEQPNDRINGVTLVFRIAPTSPPAVEPLPVGVPEMCWWGDFGVMSAVRYPNGDYNCNMLPTMEGRDFLAMGYEAAYAECTRRVAAFWHHVQTGWPELQGYRRAWTAPALGVRETTRVLGEYVLTEHDLIAGLSRQQHPDIIAIADHSIDRHGAGGGGGEMRDAYGIPYRCLIPRGCHNLLMAGCGASFSSLAASSCRLSRTMMQLGQAAGTAAGLAVSGDGDLPGIAPETLRAELRKQHVQLEFPLTEDLRAYVSA
ncbi:MAG: FAD-dependent oxidoreductase [Candidatus Hydrogenedentes bacterium]|nr:FAD-dependent oxidoreductase [Candidatus Hydrogenedentota bacterium]